jgi:hypothetical protein
VRLVHPKRPRNLRQHRASLIEHLIVREAQDPNPLPSQERRPARVVILCHRLEMLAAVHLDRESLIPAEEVQDERPPRLLATKFEPREPTVAQVVPERAFGGRALAAKPTTANQRRIHAAVSEDGDPVAAPHANPLPKGEGT